MTHILAETAKAAISNDAFTSAPLMCQKFFRQCVQRAYGKKYDHFHQANAALSARQWNKTGLSHLPNIKLEIGDVLYWGATANNPFGHVAIVISETHVAHNSTLCRSQKFASKGVTAIKDLRPWQVVVRLPAN